MFADNLKSILLDKGMSQQELATKIGKGKSSVSQYISGKTVPREDVQKKIAEVLDYVRDNAYEEDGEVKLNILLDGGKQFVCYFSTQEGLPEIFKSE